MVKDLISIVLVIVSFGKIETEDVASIIYRINLMDYKVVLKSGKVYEHVSETDAHKILMATYNGGKDD